MKGPVEEKEPTANLHFIQCFNETCDNVNLKSTKNPKHVFPVTNELSSIQAQKPKLNCYSDPDSLFETFSTVSNTVAGRSNSDHHQVSNHQEVTGTFHSAASALERYSLRDINEVCDHSKIEDQTVLIRKDDKKTELLQRAQRDTSAECQVSLFSIEESVVQTNQSHECLNSFQTERVPSSTPKGQDDTFITKPQKIFQGSLWMTRMLLVTMYLWAG